MILIVRYDMKDPSYTSFPACLFVDVQYVLLGKDGQDSNAVIWDDRAVESLAPSTRLVVSCTIVGDQHL